MSGILALLACGHAPDSPRIVRSGGLDTDTDLPHTSTLPTTDPGARELASVKLLLQGALNLGRVVVGGHDFDGNGVADLFVTGDGDDGDGLLLWAQLDDPDGFRFFDVPADTGLGLVGLQAGLTEDVLALSTGHHHEVRVFHAEIDEALQGDTQLTDAAVVSTWGGRTDVVPDLDGDGTPEASAGEWAIHRDNDPCGSAFLFSGSLRGVQVAEEDAWAQITGVTPVWCLVVAQYSPGDLDGDGRAEYVVTGGGGTSVDHGVSGLFYEVTDGTTSIADADALFEGLVGDMAWSGSGAGDIDGDGLSDLVVGATQGHAEGLTNTGPGEARVWVGAPMGFHAPDSAYATLRGEGHADGFGQEVVGPGDFDGDGHDDILVGALGFALPGMVYVVHGPFAGVVEMSDPAVTRLDGDWAGRIGHAVTTLGDVDGDGTTDFAVGVLGSAGGAYIFQGPW